MMEVVIGLVFASVAVAVIVLYFRALSRYDRWFAQDLPEIENSPCLGMMRDWEIRGCKGRVVLASPFGYRRWGAGKLNDDRWCVCLAPAQARELAELIRLAVKK